ncbi:site-specific DNA-methyltransferase (adenine-specific) [Salsuginibacillus halophilus]|uniref:Site-specific DNA-methyltransferase (Adenine-specific) n=1 Tax=Salsuginibacillus halophilus TaxID=517424 RepID=A0A2P8HEE1_9BACI|nr:class I SAM-dependent methyltransferase [Salsuginibacillus halophilus]PSL44565.1 site-specific DNA-methyltransferase (adenine-specific) [Salsuginibacillus halophilus]
MSGLEKLHEVLDQQAVRIQTETSRTYLEALAEAGENIFQNTIVQTDLSEEGEAYCRNLLEDTGLADCGKEDVRRAFQLAVIKGMKEAVQPNHAMTPDAVALFIGYFVQKLTGDKENVKLLDPAMGTANLLTAIKNQTSNEVALYGAEADETLVNIAYVMMNLQAQEAELFYKDSIAHLDVPPIDVIATDLPVGLYTRDDVAVNFELCAESGHSPAHHLMIERSLASLKEGGYGIFLIPNALFHEEGADRLHQHVKNEAVILGLLQLPETMFKDQKLAKSIWIVQKKGKGVTQPQQALLAELPSFTREEALADMMQQIDRWMKDELGIE